MEKAIIGKKVGMTQIFDADGKVVPVTVIEAGPCTVVQKKTAEKDGYEAVQLGFQTIPERKLTKPEAGHQKKAGLEELKKGYESILQPFYDLWRSSSEDFEAFMYYADRLAAQIEKGQEKTGDHEVL